MALSNEPSNQAAVPAPPVAVVLHPTLAAKLEGLATSLETILRKDDVQMVRAKGYIEKYWPIVAGLLIALTRFIR